MYKGIFPLQNQMIKVRLNISQGKKKKKKNQLQTSSKVLNVDIITMDLKEIGRDQENGLIWFSTETNGKFL
jgi:hypothetical protein